MTRQHPAYRIRTSTHAVCSDFTITETSHTEVIAGVDIPLGPASVRLSQATIANRAELLEARPWPTDQDLLLRLQPASGVQVEVMLDRSDNDGAA